MHILRFLFLTVKIYSISHLRQYTTSSLSVTSHLNDKPWYSLSLLHLSIANSRSYAFVRLENIRFHKNKSLCLRFNYSLRSRHIGALRWLLIVAGDVEINPGPVETTQPPSEINSSQGKGVKLSFILY